MLLTYDESRRRNHLLNDESLDILFRKARTHRAWLDKPVSDEVSRQLYDLMKCGPTSGNCCPARILFLRSPQAKQRLLPSLDPGNVDKTMTAPVTAIIAYDLKSYDQLPKLSPLNPAAREQFVNAPELTQSTAFRNGSLQGGYFILAARSVGLDCGPMSGFDNAKVDAEFFSAGNVKSNFLCNLGHGDPSNLLPRGPRLDSDQACGLL